MDLSAVHRGRTWLLSISLYSFSNSASSMDVLLQGSVNSHEDHGESARVCPAFTRPRTSPRLFVVSLIVVLNSERLNTEDTMSHREPQRNRPFSPGRLFIIFSIRFSVHSVAFLGVLCVKFR